MVVKQLKEKTKTKKDKKNTWD